MFNSLEAAHLLLRYGSDIFMQNKVVIINIVRIRCKKNGYYEQKSRNTKLGQFL